MEISVRDALRYASDSNTVLHKKSSGFYSYTDAKGANAIAILWAAESDTVISGHPQFLGTKLDSVD